MAGTIFSYIIFERIKHYERESHITVNYLSGLVVDNDKYQ